MGTKEMRTRHDKIPEWVYKDKSGKPPFTKGAVHMDRNDIQVARDMFYQELGWDKATGAPTRRTYRKFGLGDVADELAKRKLTPA